MGNVRLRLLSLRIPARETASGAVAMLTYHHDPRVAFIPASLPTGPLRDLMRDVGCGAGGERVRARRK